MDVRSELVEVPCWCPCCEKSRVEAVLLCEMAVRTADGRVVRRCLGCAVQLAVDEGRRKKGSTDAKQC
jgi:hypothetical protein